MFYLTKEEFLGGLKLDFLEKKKLYDSFRMKEEKELFPPLKQKREKEGKKLVPEDISQEEEYDILPPENQLIQEEEEEVPLEREDESSPI